VFNFNLNIKKRMNQTDQATALDAYYQQIQAIILNKQNPVSGLMPASTAITSHGDYTDAWVRDNVYSILAVWGLALAYRQADGPSDRIYILEQSVIKLMRGLLIAMMRQANKVECFKYTQNPMDALHAKYATHSGDIVVGDNEWGHLQLDATSLFLLMLTQMTASGLSIIFSVDEVNFVQNLVHYISRTYRTPDYGIWERGNKTNHGIAELNASSIGMAKAALEALSGFNLFGKAGGQSAVIHVNNDDLVRMRIALESLLPRESASKETDSAVLSVVGFPAFAVDDQQLKATTLENIITKLAGNYGCKRFLLDGHQTSIEDSHRLYYEPHELKQFKNIECEWPLFFTYLLLNQLYEDNVQSAAEYRQKLDALCVEQNGFKLLPELYFVPEEAISAEKSKPHSQKRLPNENIPLVWAQSLYILGCLIQDGLLQKDSIDPLGRYKRRPLQQKTVIQFALLAEDEQVKAQLRNEGITSETHADIAPIQVRPAYQLAEAYTHIGRNDRLGLTGRPLKMLRTLATSQLFELAGQRMAFVPQFLSQQDFYLALDNQLLMERLRLELAFISKHWNLPGQPLIAMSVKNNMLSKEDKDVLIQFLQEIQSGQIDDVLVQTGPIAKLAESASKEIVNYLHDFTFPEAKNSLPEQLKIAVTKTENEEIVDNVRLSNWETLDDESLIAQLHHEHNLFAQSKIMQLLSERHGLSYELEEQPLSDHIQKLYLQAGNQHIWPIVRLCSGLLNKYDIHLEQATLEILLRQHWLTVGRAYSGKATLKKPMTSSDILTTIQTYNNNDPREQIIIQELILYLGFLITSIPQLFADMHTIRVGHILQLIVLRQKRADHCSIDQAFDSIMALPPHRLLLIVQDTLTDYQDTVDQLGQIEALQYQRDQGELAHARFSSNMDSDDRFLAEDWYDWRERQGSMGREGASFYAGVWEILHHCQGILIGDKLNSQRRIDSESTLAQMTSGEQSFTDLVSHLLNKIQAPVFRQLTIEALQAIASVLRANPGLKIEDTLYTDIVIGHAVRICWLNAHPDRELHYQEDLSLAWHAFYQLPPHQVANGILDALIHLLNN
jgi:phosphorylase kinase alpha/beta subunit